jgi:hypothetical protein
MSTREATRQPLRRRTRFRTRLLTVSALIAIGATALILALSGANHTTKPHAAIGRAHAALRTPRRASSSSR